MSSTLNNMNIALCKKLIDCRNEKLASWKTYIDSNQIQRCAISELPTEECLSVDIGCCNCRRYKPADFIMIDSQKVYYNTLEEYMNT